MEAAAQPDPPKEKGPLQRAQNEGQQNNSHTGEGLSIAEETWQSPGCLLSLGPVLQEIAGYQQEAVDALWGLVQADIKPGEVTVMKVVLLQSWFRGKPCASLPAPADSNFAALACVEWKNLCHHVESCMAKRMIVRNVEDPKCVDYRPLHPRFWRVTWRRSRADIIATHEAVAAGIANGTQIPLPIGACEVKPNAKDQRRAEAKRTEAQKKSGEARPSSSENQKLLGPLVAFPPAVCSEIKKKVATAGLETSSNTVPVDGQCSEIQKMNDPLKVSESFSGTKLSTAEALKAFKGNANPKSLQAARAHIEALTDDEKREFCRALPWGESLATLKEKVLRQIGRRDAENFGGRWHNAIKLDAHAVERAMLDRNAVEREGRPAPNRSEGGWLFDLARRFSPLLQAWYPKNDRNGGREDG